VLPSQILSCIILGVLGVPERATNLIGAGASRSSSSSWSSKQA